MMRKNKVNLSGILKDNVTMPKEKHLKYIPFIRKYFNISNDYVILKDYQVFCEYNKGNWLVMKDNRICFVLYNEYIKKLYMEVNNEK